MTLRKEAGSLVAGEPERQGYHPLTGEAVDSAELEDRFAIRHTNLFAVHLNESAWLLNREAVWASGALQVWPGDLRCKAGSLSIPRALRRAMARSMLLAEM